MYTYDELVTKDENIFTILMYKYFPFWPLFVGLFSIFLACAYFYLLYSPVSYDITATLIIKDENKGVDDPRITESINAFTSKKIIENEIEVIRSRALMQKVVVKLKLFAPIFEKGKLNSKSAYLTSPITVTLKEPNKLPNNLEGLPAVKFKFDSISQKVVINNKRYPLNNWIKTQYGELQFSINKNNKKTSDEEFYFYILNPKSVTANLLENLKVTPASKLATVVNLKMRDEVPERGEDILNQLIHDYHQIALEEKNLLAGKTLAFVEDRLKSAEKELIQLESQVQNYKSTEGIIDLSEQGKTFLQNISENDRKIEEIKIQLAVLEKVENYILSKDKGSRIVPATLGVNDPVLSQLLQKLNELESEHQRLSKTTAENNPIITSISTEIENIRPNIIENIRNQRSNLQASLNNLSNTKIKYNVDLQTMPKQERELLEISRQQAFKNNVYSFLLQKREETALSYAPTAEDSKVVDYAESSLYPASPKPVIVYLVACFVSLLIGTGIVSGKELISSKVMFRSEIQRYTAAPIVSELSKVEENKKSKIVSLTNPIVIEQFRQLRSTLGLYTRSFKKKKILITSSIPGEGKTYVSANLSMSLASSGKNVLLIDMDIRNPSISIKFNVNKQYGIIEYLIEKISLERIIYKTNINNLKIIPAGINIGDHSELLLSTRLEEAFEYLAREFDYIVIDTPPIDLVSDAYLLSEYCDISLLIVRHNHTPKTILQRFNYSSKSKSLSNMAIVFNGIKPRGFISSAYGFGYGYGYNQIYESKYYNHKTS